VDVDAASLGIDDACVAHELHFDSAPWGSRHVRRGNLYGAIKSTLISCGDPGDFPLAL
jgi:hypothetical protein